VEGEVAKQFGVWRKLLPLHTKRATFVIGEDRKVIAKIKSELNFTVHADEALKVLRERNKVA
jgi:peroxiredoxin Q/BCP